ncbi:MAG: hypothetical protein WAL41_19905 [Mycobacterium sp.]
MQISRLAGQRPGVRDIQIRVLEATAAAAVAIIALLLVQSTPALAFDIPLHAQYGETASGHAVAHQMADGWGGTRKIKIMEPERPWCVPRDRLLAHSRCRTAGAGRRRAAA